MRTITHTLNLRRALLALAATAASLMMVLTAVALPAQAQDASGTTITVNTDRDLGFNDEYCSLREAVGAANTNQATVACPAGSATGEDTIVFGLRAYTNIELYGELGVTDPAGLVVGGAQTPIVVSIHDNVSEGRIFSVDSGAKLALRNLIVFDGQQRDSQLGGAVVNRGTLEVTNSRFADNSAGYGGAISNFGTLKVADSTFDNNSATDGGAIRNSGTLTAVNSTFSGNSATYGGAISNSGTLTATNSTFANNSATDGGAISNGGAGNTATLRSTILANNASGGNCYGTIADGGHNVEDANTCGFDQANNSRLSTDPKLETDANGNPALKHNGGPTQTIALLHDSPAKDAIPEGANDCGTQITADQRGVKRPQWSSCDAGAYEIEKPNDPPVATDDEAATDEDAATEVDVLANDSDPDGHALSVQSVEPYPAHGEATVSADKKTVRYQPDADYNGTERFTYTISDGSGGTASAEVTVNVSEVNDAPLGSNDTLSNVLEDSGRRTIAFSTLLANDSTGPTSEATQSLKITSVSGATGGSATISGTDVLFTPTVDFNGTAGFTYTLEDDGTTNGASDPKSATAQASFTITAVNDAPSFELPADPNQTVNEDAGAQSVEGFAKNISAGPSDEATQNVSFTLQNDNTSLFSGQPEISSEGTLTHTPAPDASGTATVKVKAKDDGGTSNSGTDTSAEQTFTITVSAANDAPKATDESYSVDEGSTLSVPDGSTDLLANASDIEGDNLTAVQVQGPAHGQLALNPDGSFAYTPDEDFNGTDSFTYKASDGNLDSNVATVNITVNAVNDEPVAHGDSYAAIEDETLAAKAPGVLVNDSDPEGDRLSAAVASGPRHGRLALRTDGSFVYTPERNYSGADSFTYRASDGKATSEPATVRIAVRAASEPDPRGCTIVGTSAKDRLVGTARADVICALGGNDAISGKGGNDTLYGDAGIDAVAGGAGDDRLYGGSGGDALEAKDGSGGDLADGGSGTDACSADRGDRKRNCP